MTIQAIIESLLEKEIGLSAEAIGSETIAKAIFRRIQECGIPEENEYLNRLQSSDKELENLIEMAVIPETWFFRNKESFAFLARYVRTQWLAENSDNELRILSIPCSTGEEPYSIAMTLTDTGLFNEIGKNRFYIEATDVSNNALRKARLGIYGRESFRGKNLSFRERHFVQITDPREESQHYKWQINASVRNMIRFKKGNLVDERQLSFNEKPFHIIFCRNLLIYLSESGKQRALENIENLLTKNGILFVGHVERSFVCGSARKDQFSWIRRPGVFACQRTDPDSIKREPDSALCLQGDLAPRNQKFGKTETNLRLSALEKKECKVPLHSIKKIGVKKSALVQVSGLNQRRVPDNDKMHTPAFFPPHAGPGQRPGPAAHNFVTEGVQDSQEYKREKTKFSEITARLPEIRCQETHGESLLDSAQKLADQGDLNEAVKICEKFLTENAFHIQAHFLMGLICHALDDEERAEEHFNKAVYLDPNHYEALSHLAFIMEHRGDNIRAAQMRQRAHRILLRGQ